MAGFSYRKNLDGSAYSPTNMYITGKDSVTFQVGDLVRINTSGVVDVVDATEGIAGVCTTVVTAKGLPVDPDSGTTDTWTTGSSNTKLVGFIPALPNYLFYNDGDASNATTDIGAFTDVTDHNSAANSYGDATAQLKLIEVDPDHDGDLSKGLYQIAESQFGTTVAVAAA